jgi:hypothetical protein
METIMTVLDIFLWSDIDRATMLTVIFSSLLIIGAICGLTYILMRVVFRKQIDGFERVHPILGGYIKKLPFILVISTFIAMEIVKQVKNAQGGDYSLYALPFHVSSFPIYFFTLAAFAKPRSKTEKYGFCIAAIASVVISLMVIIAPHIIFGGAVGNLADKGDDFWSYLSTWHPIINHMITVLGAGLIFTMGYYTSFKGDARIYLIKEEKTLNKKLAFKNMENFLNKSNNKNAETFINNDNQAALSKTKDDEVAAMKGLTSKKLIKALQKSNNVSLKARARNENKQAKSKKWKVDYLRIGISFVVNLIFVGLVITMAILLQTNYGNTLDYMVINAWREAIGEFWYFTLVFVAQSIPFILVTVLGLIMPYGILAAVKKRKEKKLQDKEPENAI